MSKPRPRKLYAVVKTNRPSITHLELYADTDMRLEKDEEMWEVEVRAIKVHKKRVKAKKRR